MQALVKAKTVQPLEPFIVEITFDTDEKRTIDLESYLTGPVFEPVRADPEVFKSVRLERGVLTWGEGEQLADIDPDVLYYGLVPAHLDEVEAA